MGSSRNAVPDAWEDDWETQADKQEAQPTQEAPPPAPMTKAERRAQHAETNRKLWESADTRETFHFVEATSNVPLASTFKPQVKVLSRKPPPSVARRVDPVTGAISQLSVRDDDDDDDDEAGGRAKAVQPTPEEIRARQQREREEKQKRYDEARAKIFGESNPSSGATSPAGAGTVTPPRPDARGGQRGGRGRDEGARRPGSRPETPRSGAETRELYDPNFAPKPGFALQRRGDGSAPQSGRNSPKDLQEQPRPAIRAPRGPDGSGRGGFGFARRGSKEA
ncbi:hypothetical protein BN1708_002456 [Verticillium longisporum]|uniref:Uncharacterized protein n=1 Tax=Verticillium longisporum TaxID=100787 RepID=A0A0G4KTM3_VERLO|nr:hypothetical protein BN1708_002456 [Verticillium longisporum]